jgi:predicted DNA-binding transcriptional regulator AlpA
MTLGELAAMTRISVNTLRSYRPNRKGPKTFKLGRRVVAERFDVEAWIAEAYESGTGGVVPAGGVA